MLLFSSLVLFGAVFSKVHSGSYAINEEADALCMVYKKACPEDQVCTVHHVMWPKNMTFPVCVPTTTVRVKSKICELPPDPGTCDAEQRRWYYNRHSSSCAWFYYTGCHGNANNFASKTICEQWCISILAQLKETIPLVLSAPNELIISQPKMPVTIGKFNSDDRVGPHGMRRNRRKRKHRNKKGKRRYLKQRPEEVRKMKIRNRKNRRHPNRSENNLTVENSPLVSDQARRHYFHSKRGQRRTFKLFSILDRDSKLRRYSKS